MGAPRKLIQTARTLRKRDTWAEKLMWRWLRDRRFSAYKFRRQHVWSRHILDFFCLEAMLNIELDGRMHGYPEQRRNDALRDAFLERHGIKVLRFWNANLRRDQRSIRDTIFYALQERAPHPLNDYCRPLMDPNSVSKTNSHIK
jgi:very-short-patch-repair endonuclease